MRRGDVAREAVEIAHERPEARRVATRAGRAPVTARIPGEDRALREIQPIDQILQPPRMLMTAMNEDEGFTDRRMRRSLPIEQLAAIPAAEDMFGAGP